MNLITLKNLLKEWLTNSTYISYIKLTKWKNGFSLVLWVFFNLVSTLICCFYLTESIQSYTSYQVVTNIETAYEQPAEFPSVLICSAYFLGKKPSSFILECKFGLDSKCTNDVNNYFENVSFYDGMCNKFNSGLNMTSKSIPIYKAALGGYADSFSVKINSPSSSYFMIINKTEVPIFGLEIDTLFAGNIFEITNGFKIDIVIDKKVEYKLGEPYNDCLKELAEFERNKTVINYFNSINVSYSQTECFNYCFELDYMQQNLCKCEGLEFGSIWSNCNVLQENKTIARCLRDYKIKFFQNSLVNKCQQYCPTKCDLIEYNANSNFVVNNNPNASNYAEVRVYLRSLKYTLIDQSAKMTFSDLVSSVGGTISLFIGLSFISLFEIVDLAVEILLNLTMEKNKINSN